MDNQASTIENESLTEAHVKFRSRFVSLLDVEAVEWLGKDDLFTIYNLVEDNEEVGELHFKAQESPGSGIVQIIVEYHRRFGSDWISPQYVPYKEALGITLRAILQSYNLTPDIHHGTPGCTGGRIFFPHFGYKGAAVLPQDMEKLALFTNDLDKLIKTYDDFSRKSVDSFQTLPVPEHMSRN